MAEERERLEGEGKASEIGAPPANGPHEGEEDLPLYRRPLFWTIGGAGLAVIIVGGLLWWLHARRYESTDDAFVDAHIVRLAAETTGRLAHVANLDNRYVRKGELLAVIEPGTADATLQEAKAGVAQAEAGIRQAEAKVIAAIAAHRQAQANALAPAATAERAARDYERYLDLKRRDPIAVADTQLDQARAQMQSTAAETTAARRQIDTAQADIISARTQVEAARAELAAARARVGSANVTMSYLRIRAPISGQLVNRQVNIGSYVAPGQQLMAIIPDQIWVTANFKETQLTHMRPGQPVAIEIDAYPGVRFAGHVDSIQRGAGQAFAILPPQNATGNFVKVVQRVPVRIILDRRPAPQYVLGPGMSATPRVRVR